MINQNVLEDMKANAFLVNTSRGPVVNQSHLYRALVSKEILGAALDVFCSEPPDDIEFLQLPQLMVTIYRYSGSRSFFDFPLPIQNNFVKQFLHGIKFSSPNVLVNLLKLIDEGVISGNIAKPSA